MSEANGGDLLAQVLVEHGVDTAFGVVSVHNLPLVEAIDRRLRFVPVRHEAAAVNAADGCARAGGGLGVAITSTGTGAGNAAGSLVEALAARSRVLHVTGQIEVGYLGSGRGVIHETRNQLGMLAAVSTHAATVRTAEEAGPLLRWAAQAALGPTGGPVSVEWPIDLQYAPQPDLATGPVPPPGPAPTADPAALADAVALIAAACRPLIWAGGGARGCGEAVRRLAELTGAGVLSSNSGRGTVPEDDPMVIGNFATHPGAARLLADADLLIAIGTHFRSNETRHYALRLPERQLQVDLDPDALGRVYPATVGLHGAAERVLPELLAMLRERSRGTEPTWPGRVRETREAVREQLRRAIGPYAPICAALREQLPRDAVIARDVTIPSSQWGNRLLDIYHPATNIFPLGGGIGQGLAMGIGAALARPRTPTAVLAGDGGLAVHLGELATLAEQHPRLVVVLFNDGGYGVLRNMQDAHGGRRAGVDLLTPDFARAAAAVGLPHQLVRKPDAFDEALRKALAEDGPSVLEVDVTALGPPPAPFVPPVHIPGTSP
jgi:acetolactate synthase I/II/III large subunit